MASNCFGSGVHVMIFQPEFFTRLLHNRRYLHIVRLNNSREQMVGGLVVEGSSKYCPEPAVSGIVLSCSYLQLSPGISK